MELKQVINHKNYVNYALQSRIYMNLLLTLFILGISNEVTAKALKFEPFLTRILNRCKYFESTL